MLRGDWVLKFILQLEVKTSPSKEKLMMIVRPLSVHLALTKRVPVCKELGGGGESICSANAKGLLDW
jgi:hypothetical protein